MTTTLDAAVRAPRARRVPSWSPAAVVHVISLAAAPLFIASQLTDQWFWWDEFDYLGSGRDRYSLIENLLRPHNEHWSVLTGLLYGMLKATVGLGSYWPYLIPVLVVHLVVMHVLWRIMIRLGSQAWVATTLAAIFGVVGAGFENVVWAFQIAFVSSTALGLAAVLLLLLPGRLSARRQAAIAGLLIASLATSGVGLTYVVVVGALLTTISIRLTARVLALPIAVYALWSAVYGMGPAMKSVTGADFLLTLVEYVVVGITATADRVLGLGIPSSVPTLLLALAVVGSAAGFGFVLARRDRSQARSALLIAAGAPAFFLIAGAARVTQTGGEAGALASRYFYVVVVMVLPLAALLITRIVARGSRVIHVGMTIVAVIVLQMDARMYVEGAHSWQQESDAAKRSFAAQAELLLSGAPVFADNPPESLRSPELVTQADLRSWNRSGDLRPGNLTAEDRATAAVMLQVSVERSGEGSPRHCMVEYTTADLSRDSRLIVPKEGVAGFNLRGADGTPSRTRLEMYEPGVYLISGKVAGVITLDQSSVEKGVRLCG